MYLGIFLFSGNKIKEEIWYDGGKTDQAKNIEQLGTGVIHFECSFLKAPL